MTDLDTQGQLADLSKQCLEDLFITDPVIDRARLITSKGEIVNGTCDWITQKEEFINWITSDSGLLWISGGPGLGKTMLSIYLTEYLSSYFRSLENGKRHFSTYFFCDAKDNTRNNSVAIIRGLIFQLLQQKRDLIKHILPTYAIQSKRLFQQNSFETIWNIFLEMTHDVKDSRLTCILDGLDECEPESLQDLLNKLNKVTSTSPNLKTIILSREYPSCLRDSLNRFPRIRLDPDAQSEVNDGLDLYISARVAELSESKKYPAELTDFVKMTLKKKSEGTYLWVSFVIKDLRKVEVSEVEESLDQLPQGLYPLYERILEQVDSVHRSLTLDILRWCMFAVRPLTISELASALKIKPTDFLDREAVFRGKLTYCGHFLSISHGIIWLVHQSAHDFLTRKISNHGKIPWFSMSSVELEHSKLASACIAHFHDVHLEDEAIFESNHKEDTQLQYPFFHYARHRWYEHFNHSGQCAIKILDEHSQFFSNSSILTKWARGTIYTNYSDMMPIAATLGLTILMQRILEEKCHLLYWKYWFAWSQRESALREASKKGHLLIVKLLVKHGVYVDCEDKNKITPYILALACGHREVAEFLLTCGADATATERVSPDWLKMVQIEASLGRLLARSHFGDNI